MLAKVVMTGVAALAMAGASMADVAWARGGGGSNGGGGGARMSGGGGGGGGAAMRAGGGAPSMRSNAAPSFRSNGPSGMARSFSGPSRSFSGGNRFAGNNNWRGDWRNHGRHFRGVVPFAGAYAYTYPYYGDGYYGSDSCAYADPGSWWWQRYCAPYGGYGEY